MAALKCSINHFLYRISILNYGDYVTEERQHWLEQGRLTNAELNALEESIARQEQEHVERRN